MTDNLLATGDFIYIYYLFINFFDESIFPVKKPQDTVNSIDLEFSFSTPGLFTASHS